MIAHCRVDQTRVALDRDHPALDTMQRQQVRVPERGAAATGAELDDGADLLLMEQLRQHTELERSLVHGHPAPADIGPALGDGAGGGGGDVAAVRAGADGYPAGLSAAGLPTEDVDGLVVVGAGLDGRQQRAVEALQRRRQLGRRAVADGEHQHAAGREVGDQTFQLGGAAVAGGEDAGGDDAGEALVAPQHAGLGDGPDPGLAVDAAGRGPFQHAARDVERDQVAKAGGGQADTGKPGAGAGIEHGSVAAAQQPTQDTGCALRDAIPFRGQVVVVVSGPVVVAARHLAPVGGRADPVVKVSAAAHAATAAGSARLSSTGSTPRMGRTSAAGAMPSRRASSSPAASM